MGFTLNVQLTFPNAQIALEVLPRPWRRSCAGRRATAAGREPREAKVFLESMGGGKVRQGGRSSTDTTASESVANPISTFSLMVLLSWLDGVGRTGRFCCPGSITTRPLACPSEDGER
jgi:hypothetical protein